MPPLVFSSLVIGCLLFSSASGQSWTGNGPYAKSIRAIAQAPDNPSVLYTGAFGWGVFKSTDDGGLWVNDRTGMTNSYVRSLLALPAGVVFAGTNEGVFRSTNGGSSWSSSLPTANSVRALALDPSTGAIYAGTFGSGLYKTINQGASWTALTVTDPVSGQTLLRQRSVAVFGANSLYVGGSIGDIASGGALFKSVDGGASWVQVQRGTGIRSSVLSISISPAAPSTTLIIGTAALGIYRSTNAGGTWNTLDGPSTANPLADQHVNVVAINTTRYYAGTDSTCRLYYRTVGDTSAGWRAATGFPGPPASLNTIRIHPVTTATVYAGTEGSGMFRTTTNGSSWAPLNQGLQGTAARTVKINGDGAVLVGTEFGDGIWRSTNQGAAWVRADSLDTSNSVLALATTSLPSRLYAAVYGSGVYRSTDGGFRWVPTDTSTLSSFVRSLATHPLDPTVVYVGTGGGVYRTSNGGASWLAANGGMPPGTSVRSLALDASAPLTLYAGTDSSYLFKTTNGGALWTNITSAQGFLPQDVFIRSIMVDGSQPQILFAGADSGRIYRSSTAGTTWTLLAALPTANSVRGILRHPGNRAVLVAATFGGGIFMSGDSGGHWSAANTGLPDSEIYSIAFDGANPPALYAGTGSHGVFRIVIQPFNAPPVLAPIGPRSVFAGQALSFRVSAADPDATTPALTAAPLPAGAVFTDSLNGSGRFFWIPSVAQIGVATVTVTASDGLVADSETVSVTVLDPGGPVSVATAMDAGWNLVSLPVHAADPRTTQLFPTASSAAFAYGTGYTARDTLRPGEGYWLKFPTAQTVTLVGPPVLAETVAVQAGWNLIGSSAQSLTPSQVVPVPPVGILSPFYGFSPGAGYVPGLSLVPGRAYWVKVSGPGLLVLGSPSAPPGSVPGRTHGAH